jgi:hypothetical protein
MNSVSFFVFAILLLSCSANKKVITDPDIPSCLEATIKTMAADPKKGSPLSVTRYTYQQKTVYYMVSPCCDKYNVVYDTACNILGYPDGGFTGRGDGSMNDFRKEATNEKLIWEKK